ncbi:unnamed protein product [Clonostachys rosea f. rosea IK726]|uniref:Uncharacterized protein n=1 Tax=Clonostachys rosea f. rosea IK726 TaxID=1349383 RepID=A0ACA9TU69_BIOOC|nr:unnamed protein product [Clonostachys rosea f. rosea IK726]
MPHMREVKTCDRCRHFKRRCDLLKPSCTRCVQAGVRCSFEANGITGGGPSSISSLSPTQTSDEVGFRADSSTPGAGNGLISPSTSTEDADFVNRAASLSVSGDPTATGPEEGEGGDEEGDGDGEGEGAVSAAAPAPAPVKPPKVVRKRKRNCLSCLRCHRLKVKCDKELPCGRCKSSGNGRECYYSYNKGPNGGKFPCPTVTPTSNTRSGGDITKSTQATWHVSHEPRGASHWRDLMTKIGALTTKESPPLAAALENVATNACLANFTLPGNFPFGTPGATKYYSRDAVIRLIESERPRAQIYIDRYINLLDCVNPIVDVPQFKLEVESYWLNPDTVTLDWLAQLLMVMGLGAFATPEEPSIATELMMGAEACIMQTPFMFRPTFTSLKAMCLVVVAKQVCNPTCWFTDSCWSLLGLLVRMSFIYGLPQETIEIRDNVDRGTRRRLWLTIIYLDIKISMPTGMPPLTRPDELRSLKSSMPELVQTDPLQQILSESLPAVLSVLVQINSSNDQIPYAEVLRHNAQIRNLIAHAKRVIAHPLQRVTVDIYLRRCLMVLHRPFALHLEGPTLFPESYWSSLECSLAVLMHYRDLWSEDFSLRYDLVGRAFTMDFFSAALQASVHVLRKDAPLADEKAIGCQIPPRQIILETLESCIEIWDSEQQKSVCWRTAYDVLTAIMKLMPDAE